MTALALEASGLCKSFGALSVAQDVNLALPVGARHALIGPNGAGKTTLINLLTGTVPPTSGSIWLDGRDVTPLSSDQRVKHGLSRTFQISTLFAEMTPLAAASLAVLERDGQATSWLGGVRRHRAAVVEALQLLERLGLDRPETRLIRQLAYGEQRLVEIALALAGRPKVLLLDEPMAGVPPEESGAVLATIDALPAEIAILVIEHDMDLVFRLARRITVMMAGAVLVEGDPQTIAADPRVQAIYLGDASLANDLEHELGSDLGPDPAH